MTRYLLLFAAFVFILKINASAQERPQHGGGGRPDDMPKIGVITGTVKDDATGQPVQYANVVLYSMKDNKLITGTIADEKGFFKMDKLPFGRFNLEVHFIGYSKKSMQLSVNPKVQELEMGVITIAQAATTLDEVEISADRKIIEYKIDKKVINVSQDLVAAGGTAVDVLENTPSVQTDIDGNVSLRGTGSFKVLIDGRPSILDGSEALQQIPSSTIEQIEIITNPSAKYDPEGVGGIINVITKKEKERGFNGLVNLNLGSEPSYGGDVLLNYRYEKVNFFIKADYNQNKGPGKSLSELTSEINDTTYYINSSGDRSRNRGGYKFKGGFEYDVSNHDFITVSGEYGSRLFGMNNFARYEEYSNPQTIHDYYLSSNEFGVSHNFVAADAYYQHKFEEKNHEISMNANFSRRFGEDTETLDEYDTDSTWFPLAVDPIRQRSTEDDKSIDVLFKTDYVKPLGENGKLEAGYQGKYDNGGSDFSLDRYDVFNDEWVYDSAQHNNIDFILNVQAVYATFTNSFKGVDFMLGLRGEYTNRLIRQNIINEEYPVERFDYFPTVHFSKKFLETHQLQASYSRRIDRPRHWYLDPFPNYSDPRNIRIGNPELLPEYVDSYELNYQKRFDKSFVSLETYYRQTNGKISRVAYLQDDNVMVSTFANIDKDYSLGIELMGNMDLFKWWQLNVSGNLFQYNIDGQILEADVNQSINTWSARFSSTFKLKWGTRIQLTGFYNAPSITAQGEMEDFYMVNAALRQDFLKRKLSVSFNVKDIFQTMNHTSTTYGSNYMLYSERNRVSPQFRLSISYRINNYNPERKKQQGERDEMDGME